MSNNDIEYICKDKLDEILKPIRDVYENKSNSDYTRTRIIQAIKETLKRSKNE